MKVVDIADELFNELGSPATLSLPAIAYWLRANIGSLSNYLNEDFGLASVTLDIEKTVDGASVLIEDDEKDVLKKMYHIHYYDILVRSTLAAAGTDSVVEIQSDDTRVRRINKNELTKTYISLKRTEQAELSKLINGYKLKKASPRQIAGDDTVKGQYPHRTYENNKNRTQEN
tara:strand:- start:2162 stop:2680 length:519 start_codon:yes stop_codon:yes gene_type:complete